MELRLSQEAWVDTTVRRDTAVIDNEETNDEQACSLIPIPTPLRGDRLRGHRSPVGRSFRNGWRGWNNWRR